MSTTEQTSSTAATADSPVNDLRIFVGNLPLSADAKVLKSVFREVNARAQVNVTRVTRAPRGLGRYAIVTFKSEEDKTKGVDSLAKTFEGEEPSSETAPQSDANESKTAGDSPEESASAQNGTAKPTKLTFGAAPFKPRAPKEKKPSAGAAASASASASGEGSNGETSEARNADANASADASADSTGASSSGAPKEKTSPKPKRLPTKIVPRPSAVYVTLPPHTEADEVRELLSGFPSVEIKLGHKRGRTVTRRAKRVDIPEKTYAVVTVGEDHQQRAIEQLDGKIVREFRISAKPSSQRLLAQDAKEEARVAKKADEADPEAQPNAEHAEHAEQVGTQAEPSE